MLEAGILFGICVVALIVMWLSPVPNQYRGRREIARIPPSLQKDNVINLDSYRIIQELRRVKRAQLKQGEHRGSDYPIYY